MSEPSTVNHDTVNVDDDTYAAGDATGVSDSTSYSYDVTFTCSDDAGTVDNTASLIGDGGAVLGSDSASVTVECADVPPPTGGDQHPLTQGYWKNHNPGNSGVDPKHWNFSWAQDFDGDGTVEAFGAGENFFDSGLTWIEMFNTDSNGNVVVILSYQYMAATLNVLNEACQSDGLAGALVDAEAFLTGHSANWGVVDYLKATKAEKQLREATIGLARYLDQYNNGQLAPCAKP